MAFHPYPRVIPSVFNRSGFGPPRGLTPASPCPWIAHPASRPRHATQIALFRLAFAAARCPLTSPHAASRRLILQKARRHTVEGAPTARGRAVSGAVSLPSRGAFHLSLAVLVRYRSSESVQPWRVVPPASDRVSRARPYSGSQTAVLVLRVRGSHPLRPAFPCRSARTWFSDCGRGLGAPGSASRNTCEATAPALAPSQVWARALSLAATRAISVDFSSSGYLDVSVPPVVPRADGLRPGSRP